MSSGASFSCAIGSDGNAYCWGTTLYTITGNMHYGCVPTVVPRGEIPAGVSLTQISSGHDYACALASNNGIYCWGRKISNGSDIDSNSPVTVARGEIPADAHIVQISAGDSHVCVLDSDGRAYCWGYGSEGQLGNSVAVNSSKSPVAVSQALGALPGVYFVQLSSGGSHTCAIASDNKTYCWGRGQEGQLGQNYGSAGNAYRPVQVNQHNMLLGDYLIFVSLGTRYSCSISSLGLLYCWGKNNFNQLGNGLPDNGIASYIPTATIPSLTLKLGTDLTIPITGSNFTDTSLSFTIPAYATPSLKDVSLTNNTTTQNSNTLTSGFRYYSKPNPPTNLTISNSQPTNSLTLTWTSPSTGGIDSTPNQGNNFSPITDYQIDYCIADPNNLNQCQDPTNSTPTTTNPTNWLSYPHTPIQSAGLTNLSTQITNLNPDQRYLIRIAAINQAGLSTYLTSQAKVPSYVTLSATPATTINLTPIYLNTVSTGAVDINFATNMNNGYRLSIEKSGNNTDGFGYTSLDVDGINQEFPSAGRLGRAEWGFSMPNIPINTTRNQINLSQFTTTQDPVTNQDADLHMDKYSLLWPVTAVNATEIARYNAPDTGRRRIMIGINIPNTQASGTYQVILLFTMIGS